jgi:hypothetical protein
MIFVAALGKKQLLTWQLNTLPRHAGFVEPAPIWSLAGGIQKFTWIPASAGMTELKYLFGEVAGTINYSEAQFL